MRLIAMTFVAFLTAIAAGPAAAWTEPARGSDLRADLMDAVRPLAEWQLGAPVQFVVEELRVAGDVAFAGLHGQRPGGGAIDLYSTPGAMRGDLYPEDANGPILHALLVRSDRMWVAVDWTIGATEAWWSWHVYCPQWAAVIPESCR